MAVWLCKNSGPALPVGLLLPPSADRAIVKIAMPSMSARGRRSNAARLKVLGHDTMHGSLVVQSSFMECRPKSPGELLDKPSSSSLLVETNLGGHGAG